MILCVAEKRRQRLLLGRSNATCAPSRRAPRNLLADTSCSPWTRCTSSCRCMRLARERSDDVSAFTDEAGKTDPREYTMLQECEPNVSGDKLRSGITCALGPVGYDMSEGLPMPREAVRPPQPASRRFPSASPIPAPRLGKQKAAPKDRSKPLIFLIKSGAGDGIRTHDPNLGKRRQTLLSDSTPSAIV